MILPKLTFFNVINDYSSEKLRIFVPKLKFKTTTNRY